MILILTDTDLSPEGAEVPLDLLRFEDFPNLDADMIARADVIVALVPRGQMILKSNGGTGPCSLETHFDFILNPIAGLTALDPDQEK